MHRLIPLTSVAWLVVALAGVDVFAGGFQLNEHGARSMAQAGAFCARASDPSALFFNPAGLSFQRGTTIMAGATFIAPRYIFYGPINLTRNDEWEMKRQVFFPPNIYVTNTWNDGLLKGLGVGIGLVTPYGLGTKWDDEWIGKSITRQVDLQTYYIMPTVSYAVNDALAIGVGANLVLSRVMLSRAVTTFDPSMSLELDGTGKPAFSWNAGILVHPLENLSLGFTYRARTDVDFDGTADFHPPASLASLFPGGDVRTSIAMPATWFAGVAWTPTENLQVEFDVQGIGWSAYDKLTIDFVNDATVNPTVKQSDAVMPKNYKDAFIFRFGAEYAIPLLGITVRGGYFYDLNPVPDEHLEPILPDANRHGLCIGFGMNVLPNVTLDFAYNDLLFQERTTTKTTYPDGVALDGTYRGNAQLVGVDITYRF
ncbi:MAG: outer membrane protein transport protein [Bacteroidota bacterium]|nr:outer membrane protein transport protein [Bacteroidota bacterium]